MVFYQQRNDSIKLRFKLLIMNQETTQFYILLRSLNV